MLDDGRILLVGGTAEGEFGTATDSVDVFDPATDTFAHLGHLVMARADAGLLRLDADHVLVFAGDYRCCGHPANAERKRSQEILDLRTGQSAMAGDWSVGELLAIEGVESAPVIQSATGPAQLLSTGKPPGFGTAVNLGDWVGGGFPLAPGLVLGGDDNLAVLDPATGSVAPALEDDVRYRAPVVLLGPGAALVTVAPPDERPCADAYLVTVR